MLRRVFLETPSISTTTGNAMIALRRSVYWMSRPYSDKTKIRVFCPALYRCASSWWAISWSCTGCLRLPSRPVSLPRPSLVFLSTAWWNFLTQKLVDGPLMAKWKKPGYERLCSTYVINTKNYKFGTVSICRVSPTPPGSDCYKPRASVPEPSPP